MVQKIKGTHDCRFHSKIVRAFDIKFPEKDRISVDTSKDGFSFKHGLVLYRFESEASGVSLGDVADSQVKYQMFSL